MDFDFDHLIELIPDINEAFFQTDLYDCYLSNNSYTWRRRARSATSRACTCRAISFRCLACRLARAHVDPGRRSRRMRKCAGRHQPCLVAERIWRRRRHAVAHTLAAVGTPSNRWRHSAGLLRPRSRTALRRSAAGLRRGIRPARSLVAGGDGPSHPGWTASSAEAHLAALGPALLQATVPPNYGAEQAKQFLTLEFSVRRRANGISPLRAQYEDPFWLLLGIAALVFLTACANSRACRWSGRRRVSPSWRCGLRSAPRGCALSAS